MSPDKQPRFASSKTCIFWSIFKPREWKDGEKEGDEGAWVDVDGPGLNDWRILTLESKKGSSEEEEEDARAEVLAGMTVAMAERLQRAFDKQDGNPVIATFATLDPDADGYYVVEVTSAPYTLQEDTTLDEYTPEARADLGAEQAAVEHEEGAEEGGD